MILHKDDTSYAVDPREVAELLASNLPDIVFDTGIIPHEILRVWEQGKQRVVIAYRQPQLTGIWLEGESDALQIPLPGLIIARATSNAYRSVQYSIIAATERPERDTSTYHCPLPNTAVHGSGICWGNVPRPSEILLRTLNLQEDWANFLGSHFGSHSVQNKSKSENQDIRKLLRKLNEDKVEEFPISELVDRDQTFGEWSDDLCQ